MKLLLNIDETEPNKVNELITYLNAIDFVTIESEVDFTIPDWHKKIVRSRIENIANEPLVDWEDVKKKL